jgi:hypothetical protein
MFNALNVVVGAHLCQTTWNYVQMYCTPTGLDYVDEN